MRKLVTIVAAVIGAVVLLSVISGQMATGIGIGSGSGRAQAAAPPSTTPTDAAAHRQVTGTLPTVGGGSAASVSSSNSSTAGAVRIAGGDDAIVYRLPASTAVATGSTLTLYGPAAALTSTSGMARRSTSSFVSSWAGDPLASTLPGVVLTADGVRHAVLLSAPAAGPGRLSFTITAAQTVSAGMATETGITDSGAVAGVSGTLARPVLFVALTAGRTVRGCQLVPGTDCDGKDLSRLVFSSVQLAGASLRNTKVWQSVFHLADLTRADLTGLQAFRSDLSDVTARDVLGTHLDLTQGSARGADFSGSMLSWAKFYRADISNARFDGAQLMHLQAANVFGQNASFAQAGLSGAQFPKADLSGADFRGADLRGVNFDRANLTGADFSGADLTGAIFNRATITRASFAGATFGHTKCPDGILHTYTSC